LHEKELLARHKKYISSEADVHEVFLLKRRITSKIWDRTKCVSEKS